MIGGSVENLVVSKLMTLGDLEHGVEQEESDGSTSYAGQDNINRM